MSDIEIEIDGKPLTAKHNSMVIQVADAAGIYIPRFCYHKHLSIAANCRMCLVEVEKSPKALPACATPVMPGMKVFTRSPKALAAQKAVMEFLLINHPLDCPICDQGGECELQDISMGFGSADSFFNFGKRSVLDQDIGPLVQTDMTRCIQCTRCVRFGDEIAGLRELGATGRGEEMEIGTYVQKALQSEVSGNIIDLCPVGALTSKPFRFTARAWELSQFPTIAAHDCIGSNLYAHTRSGKVMRMVPRENVEINETWISDRDRFSYEGFYHTDRLEKPMILVDQQWQETDWMTALEVTATELRRVIKSAGPEEIAAAVSPNSTLEEFYLLQKLLRQLGSNHVDHRLRDVDFSDQHDFPLFPGLSSSVAEIENCDVIVLIGSNIQKEQPMAALRVRKAVNQGARVIAVNMMDYSFHFKVFAKKIVAPHHFVQALNDVACDEAILSLLNAGKKVAVLVGTSALHHPEAARIRGLANKIASQHGAILGYLTDGANTAGAWIAGAVPHRKAAGETIVHAGLNAQTMWKNPRKAYVLMNVEPELDCANPPLALSALEQAEFVVALTMFKNPTLKQYAKVILPITPFVETSGTFVNLSGVWQRFKGIATPVGASRPAWKVLRVLGNLMHCEGFDYQSSEEIYHELHGVVEKSEKSPPTPLFQRGGEDVPLFQSGEEDVSSKGEQVSPLWKRGAGGDLATLSRIGDIPIYAGDSLLRRAKALQATQQIMEGNLVALRLHPETADQLHLKESDIVLVKQNQNRLRLPVIIDMRVPVQAAYIAGAILATNQLSELFGPIEVQKA